jgi:flagellar hook-basal body complex protein FliE
MRITTNPAIAEALAKGTISAPIGQPGEKGDDFARMLMDVLKEVNDNQQNSSRMQTHFQTNDKKVEYHDVMIAMEKASVGFQLTLAVRNKLLEAYQEINRMQV